MKKFFILFLVFILVVQMFTACQSKNEVSDYDQKEKESNLNGEEEGEPKGDLGSSEKIVLSMMDIWTETEPLSQAIVTAVEQFEKANSNVTIEREIVPEQALLVQVPTLAAANELPNIVSIKGSMSRSFASTGAIISLQKYIDADKEWKEKVYPSAWLEHTYNGEAYAQPISDGNYGYIVYNTAIFEEVGIDKFPETLDELYVAADKLKEAGYIPFALGHADLWAADSINFSAFVNNFVGNEWTENIFYKTGKAAFTDQPFIDALAAFQEIAQKGYFNSNFVSIPNTDALALYMNGKAAMKGWGDWEEPLLVEQAPEIAEVSAVAAWPAPSDGAKATNSYVSSSAWGFAIGSKTPEESIPYAVDFISHYVCSDDWAKYMIEEKYQFSPWKMPDFDKSKLPSITQKRIEFKEHATPCLNYDSILDPTVKDIYQRGLQSLLIGEITPEQLAKDMQAEYEMILDNEGK